MMILTRRQTAKERRFSSFNYARFSFWP